MVNKIKRKQDWNKTETRWVRSNEKGDISFAVEKHDMSNGQIGRNEAVNKPEEKEDMER